MHLLLRNQCQLINIIPVQVKERIPVGGKFLSQGGKSHLVREAGILHLDFIETALFQYRDIFPPFSPNLIERVTHITLIPVQVESLIPYIFHTVMLIRLHRIPDPFLHGFAGYSLGGANIDRHF